MGNNIIKKLIKKYSNIHVKGDDKSVMVFSTPRSGSTWLMELIWSQPGFKYCNEPLNLRNPLVPKNLKLYSWDQLYNHKYTNQILDYFERLNTGKIKDLNPNPFNEFYKFKTSRVVFKILHGMEDRILLLANHCNAIPLLLIRHPIAVSVSREVLPRIEAHFSEDFLRNIPHEIVVEAKSIIGKGSFLQKAVVCWCFENYYPLKEVGAGKYMYITYEEMVLDPKKSVSLLAPYLGLKDEERIIKYITKPSKTTNKSDAQTKQIISKNYSSDLILNKWRKKIKDGDIEKTQYILDVFGIDLYKANEAAPVKSFERLSSFSSMLST